MAIIHLRTFILYVALFTGAIIGFIILWTTYRLAFTKEHDEGLNYNVRRHKQRDLLSEEESSPVRNIIYAPGHEPTHHQKNETDILHDLEKSRRYDVDVLAETIWYVAIAGTSTLLSFCVFVLLLVHTIWIRTIVAQEAYEKVYKIISVEIPKEELRGICNLYINNKILNVMRIFAFALPIYDVIVLLGLVAFPKALLCTTDPAWVSLVHLPINAIAMCLLILAIVYLDRHFVLIHSVFTMYSTVFLCSTLFGLASGNPLCIQTIATQLMLIMSVWIFFWSPKIAGLSSLRDRLTYERQVLKEYDQWETIRRHEELERDPIYVIGSSSENGDDDDVDITIPIGVNL